MTDINFVIETIDLAKSAIKECEIRNGLHSTVQGFLYCLYEVKALAEGQYGKSVISAASSLADNAYMIEGLNVDYLHDNRPVVPSMSHTCHTDAGIKTNSTLHGRIYELAVVSSTINDLLASATYLADKAPSAVTLYFIATVADIAEQFTHDLIELHKELMSDEH